MTHPCPTPGCSGVRYRCVDDGLRPTCYACEAAAPAPAYPGPTTEAVRYMDAFTASESDVPADTLGRFGEFHRVVRERLEAGRREYGDASFSKAPAELLEELSQEALDLAGWGYVLWCRIEAAKGAAE